MNRKHLLMRPQVMNLGLSDEMRALVQHCYSEAVARGLYPEGCYTISCAEEYFAEGTQAWFDATMRTDVNGGLNTREKLRTHDPALALVLLSAYGDGDWRFTRLLSAHIRETWSARQLEPAKATPPGQECNRRLKALAILRGVCNANLPIVDTVDVGPSARRPPSAALDEKSNE